VTGLASTPLHKYKNSSEHPDERWFVQNSICSP